VDSTSHLHTLYCKRFVRLRVLFKTHNNESGIILQTTVRGHIIKIDPELVSSIIEVQVLAIPGTLFLDILEPPSVENLMDFFDAHPQGNE
jgi:hypothetical protein